ncbi:MAG: hypothetical protein AUJ97_03210 [Bacteroidetes bacterium CG2_30_32_10]|nr:MAG: hypothetical protein AUJ97_03210 [Bacteroidetes bacterium CG2_30_32_10]
MQIISAPVSLKAIWENKTTDFTELMKIVVDIHKEIIAIDAEMHSDLENLLLINNSEHQYLWGANIYPLNKDTDFLEYTSFINIRPSQDNRNMEVVNPAIREKIKQIVNHLIIR